MEATDTSETFVHIYQIIQLNMPEGFRFNIQRLTPQMSSLNLI
jgi:hypothetical protein